MSRFIKGESRSRTALYPEAVEESIKQGNLVRIIDVLVDYLALSLYAPRPLQSKCITGSARDARRWKQQHLREAADVLLKQNPDAMRHDSHKTASGIAGAIQRIKKAAVSKQLTHQRQIKI